MADWPLYKKILAISGFLIIILFFAYLLFTLFFRSILPGAETPGPSATTSSTGFPAAGPGEAGTSIPDEGQSSGQRSGILPETNASQIARGGLTAATPITKDESIGSTLSPDGKDIQYFDAADGKFYRVDKDGNTELLTNQTFHNVQSITWSPEKNHAILEYPDGANVLYDFLGQTQVSLPQHWEDFNYAPNGDQVVAKSIGLDPENRWLIVANDNGSNVRTIEQIGENSDSVYPGWSTNNQVVAMYSKGIDFNRQEVFFLGLHDENFKSMVVEGRGFEPLWSPSGDKLIYSVYSSDTDMKPELWIVNAQGNDIGTDRKRLNVETWADKCAYYSDDTVYCAVPENLPSTAGLYPELANETKDRLYEINPQTGLKKLIAIPDGDYNMGDITVTENGYYLYFTDSATKRIHQIKLR